MKLSGSVKIQAPREKVWNFLTDPTQVAQCAPGLDSVEIVEPDKKFRATASIGFGAVKATFVTDAEWLDLDPLQRAQAKFHGKAPGSVADGTSEMLLRDGDKDGETVLDWSADVTVVGTIASLASRLMVPVTQKITGVFFDNVRKKIES